MELVTRSEVNISCEGETLLIHIEPHIYRAEYGSDFLMAKENDSEAAKIILKHETIRYLAEKEAVQLPPPRIVNGCLAKHYVVYQEAINENGRRFQAVCSEEKNITIEEAFYAAADRAVLQALGLNRYFLDECRLKSDGLKAVETQVLSEAQEETYSTNKLIPDKNKESESIVEKTKTLNTLPKATESPAPSAQPALPPAAEPETMPEREQVVSKQSTPSLQLAAASSQDEEAIEITGEIAEFLKSDGIPSWWNKDGTCEYTDEELDPKYFIITEGRYADEITTTERLFEINPGTCLFYAKMNMANTTDAQKKQIYSCRRQIKNYIKTSKKTN